MKLFDVIFRLLDGSCETSEFLGHPTKELKEGPMRHTGSAYHTYALSLNMKQLRFSIDSFRPNLNIVTNGVQETNSKRCYWSEAMLTLRYVITGKQCVKALVQGQCVCLECIISREFGELV